MGRIEDGVEQEGLPRFIMRVALSPVYRAGTLNAQPLESVSGRTSPALVRLAGVADVPALAALRPRSSAKDLLTRLESAHSCFAAFASASALASQWGCESDARFGELGLALPLASGEVFGYGAYVQAAHRRKGISRALTQAYNEHYLGEGFRVSLAFAVLGRRPFGISDPHRIATIRTLRLGPFRKLWVKTYGSRAEYWRDRLKQLRWA